MKLSSDEGRAIAFVVGLIALAGIARLVTRPAPSALPPGAEIDARGLEQASDSALQRQRALAAPLGADERIDVNAAAADELDRLPGVGPALAARIVTEREQGGAFDSAADLHAVPGLGGALLARLEPHLAFGPGAGLPRRGSVTPAETDVVREATGGAGSQGERGGRGRTRKPRSAGETRVAPSPTSPLSPSAGERLDLNRATAADLEALPGIGPALAARIVAKRDSLRGFRTIDDLVRVRGIGPATLTRLRPYLLP